MDISKLKIELISTHQLFIDFLNKLSDSDVTYTQNGKWSAIQNAQHIAKSIWFMNVGLAMPKFLLKLIFGSSKRKSHTPEETIALYKQKLQEGAKADFIYEPKTKQNDLNKSKIIRSIETYISKTNVLVSAFSESELDNLQLLHPILGKITLREMLYFTFYHVKHHHNSSKNLLDNK